MLYLITIDHPLTTINHPKTTMPTTRRHDPTDDETIEGMTAETAVDIMRRPIEPEPTPDPEADDENALVDRMRAMMAQTPGDRIYLKLYRKNPQSRALDWCCDYRPEEFETGGMQMIRDVYGAGNFQLRLIGPKGVIKQVDLSLAPEPANAVSSPVTQNSELAQVLRGMQETQNAMLAALTNRPDPMAEMQRTLALVGAMREAFGITNQAPVTAPQPNPLAQLGEALALVRGLKSTAKELADDEPKTDPADPMSLLATLAPQVIELVKGNQAGNVATAQHFPPIQPMQLPPSIEHAPNPAPEHRGENGHIEPDTQPAALPVNAPETPESLYMRGIIEDLLQLAIDGKPASEGGEFIHEKLPDELLAFMGHRYWFEMVAMRFPIIKPHEKWIREAKAEADKLFEEDEREPDTPDGP